MPILRKELSFVNIPKTLLLDATLSAEDKAVYAIMLAIPGWESMEVADLTSAIVDSTYGLRLVDVEDAVIQLEDRGYITEEPDEDT